MYTFDVVPTGVGDIVIRVAAGTATDAAGNVNPAPNPLTRVYPAIAPTVNFSTVPAVVNGVVNYTVTFSQAVQGFVAADLVVANAAVSNFAAANAKSKLNTTFTFTVTPTADGPVTVGVRRVPQSGQRSVGWLTP